MVIKVLNKESGEWEVAKPVKMSKKKAQKFDEWNLKSNEFDNVK